MEKIVYATIDFERTAALQAATACYREMEPGCQAGNSRCTPCKQWAALRATCLEHDIPPYHSHYGRDACSFDCNKPEENMEPIAPRCEKIRHSFWKKNSRRAIKNAALRQGKILLETTSVRTMYVEKKLICVLKDGRTGHVHNWSGTNWDDIITSTIDCGCDSLYYK